jgi:regulator of nucleoside diphosphate kinase
MKLDEEIVLSSADAEALVLMLGERGRHAAAGHAVDELMEVLQTAYIAVSGPMLEGRVGLHSRVEYADAGGGAPGSLTLVWPDEAAPEAGKVSVLSPMGTALLGRRLGDEVILELPRDARRLLTITGVQTPDFKPSPAAAAYA